MVHTVIENQRSEPRDWGKIKVSIVAAPMSEAKVKKVEDLVQRVLDDLQEAVTGQKPLPFENGEKPKRDKPVKGQRKLPLADRPKSSAGAVRSKNG